MANFLTIMRRIACVRVALIAVLFYSLTVTMPFAAVSLQKDGPALSGPANDMSLRGDPYAKRGERDVLPGGRDIDWPGYEAQGDHAGSIGNWSEAEQAYARAVELLDRATDHEVNQNLAALLNKLGAARFTQKDFGGAETAHRRALTIYTSTRGSEDLRVADTLHSLAAAMFEQKHGRELAGSLFFRASVVREKVLGPENPVVADSLHHLALSLYPDDLAKATTLLRRSREIREKAFGHDHPSVANSISAMALLYEAHNRRDLATPLYLEALTIREKVFGPNASETLQVRQHLGHGE